MATDVSEQVEWIADEWENRCGYRSAVLSGVRPDSRHLDNGGYHCSINDLARFGNRGDYSDSRPDDKGFNPAFGAAVDMSMSPADMALCERRVRKVWADPTDPRRRYLNAVNSWDGSGDAVRFDFHAGTAKYASPDHKWHNHAEVRRRWLLDWPAAHAIVSVLRGEPKAEYIARTAKPAAPVQPTPTRPVEEEMSQQDVISGLAVALVRAANPDGKYEPPLSDWEKRTARHTRDAIRSIVGAEATNPTELALALASAGPATAQQVIVGVLAELTPERIAALVPQAMARQVADELAARLQS